MPPETLEFEEPIVALLKQIDELARLPRTDANDREIALLRRRVETVRADLYASLTPWQRVFVATPAAFPGIESGERGVAEAIAVNLREMMLLDTPIIVIVSGEGGSGGALGIAVGDRVLMQEFAIYSVIPPEGCAAILWRDAGKKVEAAAALKLTAPDLLKTAVIDEIVSEPVGGAHTDPAAAARLLDAALARVLNEVRMVDSEARLARRYEKFRSMGR